MNTLLFNYWYDDPKTKSNGEFDCVIKRTGDLYDFYECKYFDRPMTLPEYEHEQKQLDSVDEIKVDHIGFVSIEGFDFENKNNYILIEGNDLYQ